MSLLFLFFLIVICAIGAQFVVPKYMESWIVSFVDKIVATYEFSYSYGSKALCKLPNAYVISLLLLLRI